MIEFDGILFSWNFMWQIYRCEYVVVFVRVKDFFSMKFWFGD